MKYLTYFRLNQFWKKWTPQSSSPARVDILKSLFWKMCETTSSKICREDKTARKTHGPQSLEKNQHVSRLLINDCLPLFPHLETLRSQPAESMLRLMWDTSGIGRQRAKFGMPKTTTRMTLYTFLVADPYKPSLFTVTGMGDRSKVFNCILLCWFQGV